MNNSLKYYNCEGWLDPVAKENPGFYKSIEKLHYAMCLADDIADRKLMPHMVSEAVWMSIVGMDLMMDYPKEWQRIRPVLQMILESEKINLNYIPGQNELEKELSFWKTRAALLDFYRACLSCIDPKYNDPDNIAWFNEFKEFCLINNDCQGLIDGDFEDLIQCRRNYVVLKTCGHEGYFDWEVKVSMYQCEAVEILKGLKLSHPKNEEMEIFLQGKTHAEQSVQEIISRSDA